MMFALRYTMILAAAVVCTTFVRCSQPVSGGTGTETVNTFAKLPDGSPAVGAHVKIVDARWWLDSISTEHSPVIAEGKTDHRGYCSIPISHRNGVVNIQIDHEKNGLLYPLSEDESSDLGTVTLPEYASVAGSFDSTGTMPDFLCFAGTDYRHETNGSSSFVFSKIPGGAFTMLGIRRENDTATLTSHSSISLAAGSEITSFDGLETGNRVLLDNFESGIGPTVPGSIVPVLGWYVLSDTLYYYWDCKKLRWRQGLITAIGHSPISYDSVVTDGNHAFTFSTTLDTVSPTANALIGFSLKPLNSAGINLSKMTAFSLRASGKGIIRVRFETAGLDKVNYQLSHFSALINLKDTMTSYTIPVDSLEIYDYFYGEEKYLWSSESKKVVRIEFNFSPYENKRGEKLTLTLDDFYLEGMTLADILSQQEK